MGLLDCISDIRRSSDQGPSASTQMGMRRHVRLLDSLQCQSLVFRWDLCLLNSDLHVAASNLDVSSIFIYIHIHVYIYIYDHICI